LASHADNDGFHEIQLNGKQLVFLFMAATVVSVVIFLCGVLVGRGVRTERAGTSAETSVATAATAEPAPPAASATPAAASESDPTVASPPPTVEDLSYFNRLEKKGQPKEELKSEKSPNARSGSGGTPAPKNAAAQKAAAAAAAADASSDFTVQIAALNARGEADAIAKRLSSKGYAAYVVPPGNGAVMYRVRVGKFKNRHDAEPIAARLQKEEQLRPWITR